MSTDETAFWDAIDASPGDLLPLSVFCDWLDEREDQRAVPLRWCVKERRTPCIVVVGEPGAFWVCATGRPVARQKQRNKEREPIRPQRSWLAVRFWSRLAAVQREYWFCDYVGCRMVIMLYPSASEAYRDFCRAWADIVLDLRDPLTGKSILPATKSRWRDESRRRIAVVLKTTFATADERRNAVRAAYPFGERRGHPYKIWLSEVRRALDLPRLSSAKFNAARASETGNLFA